MATTHTNLTSTSVMTNELVTVYDKYFDFGLRSEPYFRTVVDKRPVNVTNPGESVVFNFYSDLAVSTTPLTENVDPDGVALSNTTQVTVTLNEYGNKIEDSLRLRVDALNDVDAAGINQLAYNCRNSLDSLVQTKMASATQHAVRAAGAYSFTDYTGAGTAANISTITAGDAITSGDIRRMVATLRQNNVVPKVNNGSYVGFLHPQVSADLRAETGAAAWRDPHVYNSGGVENVWNAVVGQYEGVTFVESSRLTNSQAGAGAGATQYRVYDSYILGAQALAEAVNVEARVQPGPIVDAYMRFFPMTWYFFGGWSIYRQAAIVKYQSGSTARPQL